MLDCYDLASVPPTADIFTFGNLSVDRQVLFSNLGNSEKCSTVLQKLNGASQGTMNRDVKEDLKKNIHHISYTIKIISGRNHRYHACRQTGMLAKIMIVLLYLLFLPARRSIYN